jgi:glycosyltransferase involved in cell wall biosynthesis
VNKPKYSVIIPVYNRPAELRELLQSLQAQTRRDFEVIVVEDGSTVTSEAVVDDYAKSLSIRYYFKSNAGPGPARNFGFAHARGEYFVLFDSDCMLPPSYFESVDKFLARDRLDAWGGPDRGHEQFSVVQRAMAYTMSSVFTTGGIRGGKKSVGWFQPRSFNMGISRQVSEVTKGFRFDRFAEDIELSIRIKKAGFRTGLISDAFVYHKRRTDFSGFFKQVFNFGRGRALVGKVHPSEVHIAHWFPALFTIGTLILPLLYRVGGWLFAVAIGAFVLYLGLIFFHALAVHRNAAVAGLSVVAALLQMWGYGLGFLKERTKRSG